MTDVDIDGEAIPSVSADPKHHVLFHSKIYDRDVCAECSWLQDGVVVAWPCDYVESAGPVALHEQENEGTLTNGQP